MGNEPTNNNKQRLLKVLDIAIPLFTITAVIVSAIYIFKTNNEYKNATAEYEDLERIAGIWEYPDNMQINDSVQDLELDTESEAYEEKETFLNLNIDFNALKDINSDVVGWIYIPSLELSYPVLHGKDNDYYLHHTVEDKANFAGSIFIDSQCNPELKGFNTFIYGHNMKNDSMFGKLSDLIKNPDWIDMNPYIYYYTENHAYQFRIFATYTTSVNSFTYLLSENRDHLTNYINKVQTVNVYEKGKSRDLSTARKIITLSTCSGSNSGKRTIVHAGIVGDYEF